ncbi:MAG: ComEC family competence protein [Candidatus Bipolaricaulota bacterium]|nr:ComEC family competence protein [Candidatus Bipolaricaulota bacterium]
MRRALLPGLGVALGFGIAFGYLLFPGFPALAAAGALLLLAALCRSVLPLWGAAFALGMALPVREALPPPLDFQLPNLREARGIVLDLPEPRAKNASFTLAVEALGVRLLAYVPLGTEVGPRDRVRLVGRWGRPGPAAWREALLRRGIHGLFWADEVEVEAPGQPGLLRWAGRVRQVLLDRLDQGLPGPGADLLSALLLGARGRLPDDEVEAFRRAGVAHLLALSGLHVGILAAGGWWILGLLRVRQGWRYPLLVPAVGFYVLLGGARASLLRAGIMFAVLGLFWLLLERGWVLRRWLDPLQGLSLAAIIVLVVWPWSALDVGFQLSFLATAGIVLFLPSWTGSALRARLPRWARPAADVLAVTLCAQAGAVPAVGSAFGYLAPYGIAANLVLVPWTALLLWAGLLALPPWPLGPAVERALVSPYLSLVRGLASLPGAELPVGPGFGLWCLLAALGFLLLRALAEEAPGPGYFAILQRRTSPE